MVIKDRKLLNWRDCAFVQNLKTDNDMTNTSGTVVSFVFPTKAPEILYLHSVVRSFY